MKLFVDDVRKPPDKTWIVATTAQKAIQILSTNKVQVLSLDHDLGDSDETGYTIICWIEEQVTNPGFHIPKTILVHSANPVGSQKIKQAIQSIKRRERSVQLIQERSNG
jgi:translation initiation factor 2 alpha subunit (eIF-2alpha)